MIPAATGDMPQWQLSEATILLGVTCRRVVHAQRCFCFSSVRFARVHFVYPVLSASVNSIPISHAHRRHTQSQFHVTRTSFQNNIKRINVYCNYRND